MPHLSLEAAIAAHPRCQRVAGGLFSHLEHTPSGEQIRIDFRCFNVPGAALLSAFAQQDPTALTKLALALDDHGHPGISLVRLEIAHTPGGALVGAQPVLYTEYTPTPAAPAVILEGDAAAGRWAKALLHLGQTHL
ncbi:MAG: hypothetical protein AAFV53_15545 [Myxococcota bacterium]